MILRKHLRSRRRGTALVEMALVGMILILLTFGMAEYAWMFYRFQQVGNVCRQAARLGATVDATSAQVTTLADNMLVAYGLSQANSHYTLTVSPTNVSTVAKGTLLTVSISIPYTYVSATKMSIFPTPSTVHASVSMEKEGE